LADGLGRAEVRAALAEDRAADDVTTRLLGAAAERPAVGRFIAEGRFVVAGLPVAASAFREVEASACLDPSAAEGSWVEPGTVLATVAGSARALLAGERVALNFLQHLSGVATATRRAVDALRGTGAVVTHTRKTTPGLRTIELYAVHIGGGVVNRASLADAVLWKDNHWALLEASGASLATALAALPAGLPVMVEVESDAQLEAALAAGVRHILADNQLPERIAAWVHRVGPGVTIEATGGITPENARAYAQAGAARVSIGALTHSAPAAPISFEVAFPT
jgi:nicotinate-nucleotide pyrophosphorylase (carboxylating)